MVDTDQINRWGLTQAAGGPASLCRTGPANVDLLELLLLTRTGSRCDVAPSKASQLVRLLHKIVRQRTRHAAGVVHVDDVARDEPGQEVGVPAAREVVTGRDGAERSRVVVEARRLVDPRRLGGRCTETQQ